VVFTTIWIQQSPFRFIDVETSKATGAFAKGHDLGCAYAEGGTMWVFGVDNWDGANIAVFRSGDLEHWEQRPALKRPGWGLFNTSVCKEGDRYVMAIEVGRPPEVVGVPFTRRFAESKNLVDWDLLPAACVYTVPNGFSSALSRYPMHGGMGVPPLCSREPWHWLWNFWTTSGVKIAGARKPFFPSTKRGNSQTVW
jgi:hypothetical protein